jgi:hypothetical protein
MTSGHPSRLALDRLALDAGDEATRAHAATCEQCTAHLARVKAPPEGAPLFVHPSRLALDRLALGAGDEETKRHAADCALCSAQLKAVQVELPIPNWVNEIGSRPAQWWRPALAFAAMAAIALIVVALPERQDGILAKGLGKPQVQVWLNHGGQVSVWNGAKLQVNDAFRFEVQPGPFKHLTVVELQEGKLFRVLHSAPAERLSPAWAVDAQGSEEDVVVLLSKAPLSEDELQRALAGQGDVWSNRFRFPKEGVR